MLNDKLETQLLESEYAAVRYLIFKIWERDYNHEPKITERIVFTNQIVSLRESLVNYGLSEPIKQRNEPAKHFRDQIISLIKGDIDPTIGIEIVRILCRYYYDNFAFKKNLNADWLQLKEEYTTYIGKKQSLTTSEEDKILQEKVRKLKQENKGLQTSLQTLNKEVDDLKNENEKLHQLSDPDIETGTANVLTFFRFNICSPYSFAKLIITVSLFLAIIGIVLIYAFQKTNEIKISDLKNDYIETYNTIISFVQLFMIGFFIYKYLDEFSPKSRQSTTILNQTVLQFEAAWLGILISSLMMYLWFCFSWLLKKENEDIYQTTFEVFSSLNSYLYFYAYSILETKSLNSTDDLNRNKRFRNKVFISGCICLFQFAFLAIVRFSNPGKELLLSAELLFTIYAAVTMSLLIERLSSHSLTYRRSRIPIFFSYCAIQVGYILYDKKIFENTPAAPAFAYVLTAAGILKVFLYDEVHEIIRGKRIEAYLQKILFNKKKK